MADIGVRLVILGLAEFRRGISTAQQDVSGFRNSIETISGTASSIGRSLTNVGNSITGVGRSLSLFVTGPLVALGAGFVRAGIQFEDAFAGVGKVVSGVSVGFDEIAAAAKEKLGITVTTMDEAKAAAERLGIAFGDLTPLGQDLRQQFIDLGNTIPLPLNQLAELGQTVGQLGVPADKLIGVTKLIAEFATVTGMSAEDAASSLLHLGNILEGSALNFEDFTRRAGSAIIALGNASVSTEPEILALATRIAAAGDRAKFSEPDLLAWATAISDVGVRAELGGTAVSRAITEMLIAVQTGGEGIQEFAQISGQGVEQFRKAFEEDASTALQRFVAGLKKAFEEGTITKDMLEKMGLSGVRAIDVMGRLGNIQEILADRLATSNEAWDKQIQIEEEFAKRTNTVQSMIQIMKNQFAEMGIVIFDLVKADLQKLIESIGTLIQHFIDLDPATQKMILIFAAVATAIGPILIIVGLLISAIGVIITALAGLAGAIVPVTIAVGAATLGFSLFHDQAIGFVQPVIDKIKELVDIILGVPSIQVGGGNIADVGRTLHEGGTGDTVIPSTAFPDPTLIERLQAAFDNLRESIKIPPEVIDTFNQLRASVSTFGVVISDVFNAVVTTIRTTLGPSFQEVFASLTNTLNSFGLDWSDVWTFVKTVLILAVEVIGGVIIGLIGIVIGVLNAIASGISGFQRVFAEVSGAFQLFFDGIVREVAGFITIFQGIFELNLPKIIMGLSAVFSGLAEQVAGFTGIIIGLFGALVSAIFNIITGFIAGALEFFGNFWAELTGDSDNALLKIADFFTQLKETGTQLISDLVSAIIGFFQNLFDTLVGGSIVPDMVAGILTSFSDMKDSAIQFASDLVDGVIGFFENLASKVGEIVSTLFGGNKETSFAIDTKAIDEAKAKIDAFKQSLSELNAALSLSGQMFAIAFVGVILPQLTLLTTTFVTSLMLIVTTNTSALALMTISWITFITVATELLVGFLAVLNELWSAGMIQMAVVTIAATTIITTAFLTLQATVTTVMEASTSAISAMVTAATALFNTFAGVLTTAANKQNEFALSTRNSMGIASAAVDGLAGAYQNLALAAAAAAKAVVSANNTIANSTAKTEGAVTGSPELILQHPFEDFENFLKATNFGDLTNKSFAGMLDVLNSVPAPTQTIGNSSVDNSVSTNITGVPIENEDDLANIIDQRVRVARGR